MEERGAMGEIKSLVLVISGGRCEVERRGCVKKGKKKKEVKMFHRVRERCVKRQLRMWDV